MKLFKNQKGFNDTVVVAILGGIIGSIFIMTVFVWQEIEKANDMSYFYNKVSAIVIKNNNKVLEKPLEEKSGNIKFVSDELGISFEYPERFGKLNLSIYTNLDRNEGSATTGSMFFGSFENNSNLMLGGISDDFSAGRGGSILDTRGYFEGEDGYEFKFVSAKENYKTLEPLKILEVDSVKILLLDDKSFKAEREGMQGPMIGVGKGNLAALINLDNEIFAGIVIYNTNVENFSQEEFEKMLVSFDFLD